MNIKPKGCRALPMALLLVLVLSIWVQPAAVRAAVTQNAGQIYTIINTVKLENRSTRSIYNINLEVPLSGVDEVAWQEVLGEEFSPQPVEITQDEAGRRVGHYTVRELKSGETLELVQRVAVKNYCVSFDVSDMAGGELPEDVREYLQASADINCESAVIKAFAEDYAETTANPYLKARLLFAAVNSYLTYDNSDFDSHSAVTAYYRRRGNCEDYANLYAALLRAEGIPAKVVSGYLYSREAQMESSYVAPSGHINADKMRHSWVMFYINGVGWLPADPTFSYTADDMGGSVVDWSRFAQITHDNRLVYTGNHLPENNSISYDYQGAAPLISYNSELALYSLISPFADIVDHWAEDSVLGLYYHQPQLVQGLGDGNFGVNDKLTRAELATLLNRVLDSVQPLTDGEMGAVYYTDLSRSHWAYTEINKAVARGLLLGYPDGTVRPDDYVCRVEAAVMVSRALGVAGLAENAAIYTDMAGYAWADDAVAELRQSGLMLGVDGEHFAPGRSMTRGEGAAVVYRWVKSSNFEQLLGIDD